MSTQKKILVWGLAVPVIAVAATVGIVFFVSYIQSIDFSWIHFPSIDTGWFYIITAAGVYLMPYLIADLREHHNKGAIFVLNLLLGWTAIGWVIALVWAFTAVRKDLVQEQFKKQ